MPLSYVGRILPTSPRYEAWKCALGTDELPLISPDPHFGTAPGIDGGLFYLVDMARLTPQQLDGCVASIVSVFDVSESEVRAELAQPDFPGIPVLADSVVVYLGDQG
jgi:hypothetical protein